MLNQKNKVISSILIVLFFVATFVTYLAPDRVQAQTEYDNLVFQAVKAQYDSYQSVAAVVPGEVIALRLIEDSKSPLIIW